MITVTVSPNEAGSRLDKILHKILQEAPGSFIYKMLRKKNITLNGKKASGKEITKEGDLLQFYFSEDTFQKFRGTSPIPQKAETNSAFFQTFPRWIIYEDNDLLLLNKPQGVLSQKSRPEDVSLNEHMLHYLYGTMDADCFTNFKPGIVNRLDRNTSGIVIAGKTLRALQWLNEVVKQRQIGKYYLALVHGKVTEGELSRGWLIKDEKKNTVRIFREEVAGAVPIATAFRPIRGFEDCTLLEVELITGKSHQIRAHLTALGFPLVGDPKYGKREVNERFRALGIEAQMLHAARLEFSSCEGHWAYLDHRIFQAPPPVSWGFLFEEGNYGNLE